MFISKKKHEAALALMAKANVDLEQGVRALDALAAKYKSERDAARIEAAANADDAAKYRRSKANLKQFRDQKAEIRA
ncbi:hypothetical protein [Sphingobium sp. HDIP04]|uniref:hypothetical protein n=1 Tax=Sphingobium sp. HDIP04 TaxID=428994 RepID=UPI0003879DCA|nr:hypothetical protein [Sphingobium sp. HDIP04]EQB03878.1 hypothetical protein L286_10970 [Sphingobium sp. HDIP04]